MNFIELIWKNFRKTHRKMKSFDQKKVEAGFRSDTFFHIIFWQPPPPTGSVTGSDVKSAEFPKKKYQQSNHADTHGRHLLNFGRLGLEHLQQPGFLFSVPLNGLCKSGGTVCHRCQMEDGRRENPPHAVQQHMHMPDIRARSCSHAFFAWRGVDVFAYMSRDGRIFIK